MIFELEVPDSFMEDSDAGRYLKALQMLINRMGVSHHKYGEMSTKYPHSANALVNSRARREKYYNDHNTEHLLDEANFTLIGFLFPEYPDAHFSPTEAHENKLVYGGTEDK